jgi:integrase
VAHVTRKANSKGVRWQATYRAPDGRERTKTFDRKTDAERWVREQESARDRGGWIDPREGRTTFGAYASTWQAAQVHRPQTVDRVDSVLRTHVLPVFAERTLVSIRSSEVQAWVRGLSLKLSPASVEVAYRYLASIFRSAVRDRVIESSPCDRIKLPKKERRPVVPPEVAQVETLVAAMPERYRALVILAAGTGLRQGEAFGLDLDHIDFLRRSVDVAVQLVDGARAPLKTDASYRTVPLPTTVAEALAEHLRRFPVGESGLIFSTDAGLALRRNRFGETWRASVQRAGLPAGMRFHDLRHFYASLLIRHGESVKVVQLRLGHASAAETLDTYSHLWPDSEDRTREAVDSVLGIMRAEVAS